METSREILVVDDHVVTAEFLIEALRDQGYAGKAAHDGESALQAIKAAPPGLVLLDLHLPDQSGFELVKKLQADELDRIPIVLITADVASVADLPMTVFMEYLLKPFDLDTLLACVARYVCPQQC